MSRFLESDISHSYLTPFLAHASWNRAFSEKAWLRDASVLRVHARPPSLNISQKVVRPWPHRPYRFQQPCYSKTNERTVTRPLFNSLYMIMPKGISPQIYDKNAKTLMLYISVHLRYSITFITQMAWGRLKLLPSLTTAQLFPCILGSRWTNQTAKSQMAATWRK